MLPSCRWIASADYGSVRASRHETYAAAATALLTPPARMNLDLRKSVGRIVQLGKKNRLLGRYQATSVEVDVHSRW